MFTFKKTLIILPLIIFGVIFFSQAQAAIISVNPVQKEFAKGETFLAEIHLNSEQEIINAVKTTITYPTDLLEVVKVSRGGSFLTLWIKEPIVEESAGIISLAGGIPGGSMVLDGKIATITFKTKIPGVGEVDFDNESTKVLLNDGLGTEVELNKISGIFSVSDTTFINIESSTHPEESTWYKNNNFNVEWEQKKDAIYSYILSNYSDEEPDNNRESTTGKVNFSDLADGVYYFILKEKIGDGDWEVIGKRRAMIDSKAPLDIDTVISKEPTLYDGKYILIFSTTDKGSGIDYYDVKEGDKSTTHVTSPYILEDQSRSNLITVTAFDRAGNYTQKNLGIVPFENKSPFFGDDTVYSLFLIIVISIIILLLLFLAFKVRSQPKKED
ncbi:MAG: cohesin domain-containing protein [Candidatus Kerfeldbacteria bacterium]